jgi:hypothetical protein
MTDSRRLVLEHHQACIHHSHPCTSRGLESRTRWHDESCVMWMASSFVYAESTATLKTQMQPSGAAPSSMCAAPTISRA